MCLLCCAEIEAAISAFYILTQHGNAVACPIGYGPSLRRRQRFPETAGSFFWFFSSGNLQSYKTAFEDRIRIYSW